MKRRAAQGADDAGSMIASPRWLWRHATLPLGWLFGASLLCMGLGGDRWIADHLYQLEGQQWLWKDAWLTKQFIHLDGKRLSVAAGVATAVITAVGWSSSRWSRLRGPATYLLLSVIIATLIVSLLKRLTGMDCPWDIIAYGGPRPYIGLFSFRHGMAASGCFPAGHASAGYAWVALYFAAVSCKPRWRWQGLAIGLFFGAVFGISQQVRGAHFLSHDLWALAVCWYTALVLYAISVKFCLLEGSPSFS